MNRHDILEVLIDWNLWGEFKDESVERPVCLDDLRKACATGEIVTVTGVRRSGKSTILVQFLRKLLSQGLAPANTLFVNFEDPRLSGINLEVLNRIYETYLEEMLPEGHVYVVLDEVHEVAGWEKFARFLIEAKKNRVFVTGSSSKMFSEEYATLLSGRHLDISVLPLSFREFLSFKGLKLSLKLPHLTSRGTASLSSDVEKVGKRHKIRNLLKEFLEFGSFPKVALVNKDGKSPLLGTYFSDILIKDIQKRYRIKETAKLEALAKYYLTNIATIQPFNKVKSPVGLSLDSVQRFSGYFSLVGLFYFIPKFAYSLKEQMLNPRKVYSVDVGLRNAMGFRFSKDIGRLMENVVLVELKRRKKEVFYWKSPKGREVDFVIRNGSRTEQLIQVCYDVGVADTKNRELDGFIDSLDHLKCEDLVVITDDFESKEKIRRGRSVNFIPLWKWLLRN